jgi:hypothetical protein
MTPKDFTKIIYDEVVEVSTSKTLEIIESTPSSGASDPYFRRLLKWYEALPKAERELLIEVMRQTAVDTVASVLGVIDGAAPTAGGFQNPPKVLAGGRDLSGDLQESWMELLQERGKRS